MYFEYDQAKSISNLEKHGIDFEEAQELWSDPFATAAALEHRGERRWVLIARLADGVWAAIYTMRGERVRIISVRRATAREVAVYDKARNDR